MDCGLISRLRRAGADDAHDKADPQETGQNIAAAAIADLAAAFDFDLRKVGADARP